MFLSVVVVNRRSSSPDLKHPKMTPSDQTNPFEYCSAPVAGIDLSLNSPAIVVVHPSSEPSFILPFTSTSAYFLTNKKSNARTKNNITGELFGSWVGPQQRYETIAEWIVEVLQKNKVNHVGLEDYAFSKHSSITALAENMGLLKYFLYKNGISYDLYSPSSIKRCATGRGNADKRLMRDAFYEDNPGYDICGEFGRKPTDNPVSPINDIIDAYYLALSARVATAVQEREYQEKENK
jgi:hypothetical protein